MKKYFLYLFFVFALLNTVYKACIYFDSDKVAGRVTEATSSPKVIFTYNNYDWEASKSEWGHIATLELGDTVTVLIQKEEDITTININTFFQFWFTFYTIITAFCVCFVGTLILMVVLPEEEKQPKTWK